MRQDVAGLSRANLVVAALIAVGSFGVSWRLLRATPGAPSDGEGPGTITLRLVDVDGQPVACKATLWSVLESGGRALTDESTQLCAPNGRLRWTGRGAGAWRVIADSPGLVQLDESLELTEGESVDLGVLELGWGGDVAGVVTEDGEPAVGVEVRTSVGRGAVTAAGGRFRLPGMPVGELELRSARGHAGGRALTEVVHGQLAEVSIELEPMPPRGTIGFHPGEGATVAMVLPGSPAAGVLMAGDVIERVDGVEVGGDVPTMARLLSGAPGEDAVISVLRGEERLEFTVTRVASDRL